MVADEDLLADRFELRQELILEETGRRTLIVYGTKHTLGERRLIHVGTLELSDGDTNFFGHQGNVFTFELGGVGVPHRGTQLVVVCRSKRGDEVHGLKKGTCKGISAG